MIATPAWPPRSTPRLFVDQPLAAGPLRLDGPAAHYLATVMRAKPGDPVKLFDDRTGEWLALATEVRKRDLTLDVRDQVTGFVHGHGPGGLGDTDSYRVGRGRDARRRPVTGPEATDQVRGGSGERHQVRPSGEDHAVDWRDEAGPGQGRPAPLDGHAGPASSGLGHLQVASGGLQFGNELGHLGL